MRRAVCTLLFVLLMGVGCAGCLITQPSNPSAEDLCARVANAFYCQTTIIPQDPTLNASGYNGFCMVGYNGYVGMVGYSGVTGTGGASPVFPTSDEAWRLGCGANSRFPRGACNSVVRCTHK